MMNQKKATGFDPHHMIAQINRLLQRIQETIRPSLLAGGRKKLGLAPHPKNLMGELKDYQRESLAWMTELADHQLNGILADDMGLGKTIQTIAYFCSLAEQKNIKGKHIIIVPKNVLNNWLRQINKWSPGHKVVILPGTQVQRQQVIKKVVKKNQFDILICTYQSVQFCQSSLSKFFWESLVVDEAHSIKNDQTVISQCLRRYRAKFKLLLTGTPLSNKLHELWSLLNFILPEIFDDCGFFDRIEAFANDETRPQEQRKTFQIEVAQKFIKILNPFLLRRTKNEINLGLKEKKQITLFVSLTELQLKMYRNYLNCRSVYGDIKHRQCGKSIQLRKICNHPYLFPKIQGSDQPAYGEHLIENSGKMSLLDKLLKKLLKQKHKILIFSQFTSLLDILEDFLIYRKYQYCAITGQSSLDQREQEVQDFNNSKTKNIFLISTRAGGIGLNLVAADIVIIFDIDWNPQMDRQAMDRAYRIGQKNSVKVFKFITMSTIEERMLEVQKYKLLWDQLVIQKGGVVKLSNSGENKFNKIDYDRLGDVGNEEIFKIQNKFDDQTIEEIIKYGEEKDREKTKKIRQKLEKQFENLKDCNPNELFAVDTQANNKIDYISQKIGNISKIHELQPTKSLHRFTKPDAFYMFSDERRAAELLSQLPKLDQSEQKEQIIRQLNELGFYNWSQIQYRNFIDANLKYIKTDYQKIAKQIQTKNKQEVKKYSQAFYNFINDNRGVISEAKKLLIKQQEILYEQQIQEMIKKLSKIDQKHIVRDMKHNKSLMNRSSIDFLMMSSIIQKGMKFEDVRQPLQSWFGKVAKNVETRTALKRHRYLSGILQTIEQQNLKDKGAKLLDNEYKKLSTKFLKIKSKDDIKESNPKGKKMETAIQISGQSEDSQKTEVKA